MQGDRSSPAELVKSAVFQVFRGDRLAGTGFFVGPGLGVTCAHVVSAPEPLRIRYQDAWLPAMVLSAHPSEPEGNGLHPLPDLAFLEVDIAAGHPTVLLAAQPPAPGNRLFGLGFAISDAPGGDRPHPEGVLVEVVGPAGEAIRVRGDQIVPGLSGSPMLDLDEGRVCAVLKTSRHVRDVRGGWAVPVGLVESCRPGMLSANLAGHPPGTRWRDLADGRAEATRALFSTARPNTPVSRVTDPAPSWWLNPRNRAADYLRPGCYDDLLAWCHEAAPVYRVRLVVAPGGAGKTRLALELREQLAAEGWIAGLVSLATDVRRIAARLPEVAERHRVMVAVDYAETLGPELDEVIEAVGRCPGGAVRILLLARSTGPWWRQLLWSSASDLLIDRDEVHLEDIGAKEPVAVAEAAYRSFRTQVPGADSGSPPGLPLSLRERAASQRRMLDLHAIALIGVLGGDVAHPLRSVLGHELKYAARSLAAHAQVAPGANDSVVERLTLAPTLVTVSGRVEAVSVVDRLATPLRRIFAAPESVAVTLAGLFPPESADVFWGQLRPDRLAEQLLRDVAASFGSARLTSDYLLAALGGTSSSAAAQMITVIFRAAKGADESPVNLMEVLYKLAAADPLKIAPALLIASVSDADGSRLLEVLIDLLDSADLATVQALRDHLPINFRDFAEYAEFGVAIFRQLDVLLAETGNDGSDGRRADNFYHLGMALKATGEIHESIESFKRACDAYRSAAVADPIACLSKWAAAVNGIGLCLNDYNQHRAAGDTFAEAAALCRQAIAERATVDSRDLLAMILGNLSHALLSQGRYTVAAELGRESVQIRRALVAEDPTIAEDPTYRSGLVNSIIKLSEVMRANHRLDEATELAREAVTEARALGSAEDSRTAAITASAFSCLGGCLARLGDSERAAEMLAEAANILVRIAGIRGDAHMEEVVVTLSNLAVVLCRQDRYDEARRRMAQAHRLIQEAASGNLTLIALYVHTVARYAEILLEVGDLDEACRLSEWAYQRSEPGFLRDGTGRPGTPAYAALVRANVLLKARLPEHALTVIDDAIHRYRRLASSLDSAFRYDLALALNRKLDIEGALGDHEAAVAAGTEAIAVWERLIADGATDFEVSLAETLALVAQDQLALHRPSEAIVAATRSRRITAGRTDRISLRAGATACLVETRAFKDTDSTLAIAAGREAVRLFADLTAEKPLDYGAFLAEAWTDLGFAYSTAGGRPAALQASTRAVQAIEAFIQRGGDNAERVHAKCLRNLSCDLLDAGYPAEAASASRHSIQLCKSRPDLTETDILEIRDSLTNLANQCLAMNDYRGAVAARCEVQQIDRLLSLT